MAGGCQVGRYGVHRDLPTLQSIHENRLTQNPTCGPFCLKGDLKSRLDGVQEHARIAGYRRAHQRLHVEIKTQNQDFVEIGTKYYMRISLISPCTLCVIIIIFFAHIGDCVMEQQDLARVQTFS